jgi:hypothetical protein
MIFRDLGLPFDLRARLAALCPPPAPPAGRSAPARDPAASVDPLVAHFAAQPVQRERERER